MTRDRVARITYSSVKGGMVPQENPIISEPKFAGSNSGLETITRYFKVLNIARSAHAMRYMEVENIAVSRSNL